MLANIDAFVTLEWIHCDKSRRPQHREWLPNLSRQIDCHWRITDSCFNMAGLLVSSNQYSCPSIRSRPYVMLRSKRPFLSKMLPKTPELLVAAKPALLARILAAPLRAIVALRQPCCNSYISYPIAS